MTEGRTFCFLSTEKKTLFLNRESQCALSALADVDARLISLASARLLDARMISSPLLLFFASTSRRAPLP
jgi:hypothetical protein